MLRTGLGNAAQVAALCSVFAFATWHVNATCYSSCYAVSCWQVSACSSPGAYNCLRTVSLSICSLPDWEQVYHPSATGAGQQCVTDETQKVQVYECKDCDPDCDEIPGRAVSCSDCRKYGAERNDTDCVEEASS